MCHSHPRCTTQPKEILSSHVLSDFSNCTSLHHWICVGLPFVPRRSFVLGPNASHAMLVCAPSYESGRGALFQRFHELANAQTAVSTGSHLQAPHFLLQLFDPHVEGALTSDVALLSSAEIGLQSFHFLLHLLGWCALAKAGIGSALLGRIRRTQAIQKVNPLIPADSTPPSQDFRVPVCSSD